MSIQRIVLAPALVAAVTAWAGAANAEPIDLEQVRQNLFSVCAIDAQHFVVVGELGRVFHTSDGGRSFTRAETGTSRALTDVACRPDGSALAVGQKGLILRSRDKGATWEALDVPTEKHFLTVAYASDEVAVAAGDFGVMVRTADGGDTWSMPELPIEEMPIPDDYIGIIEPNDVLWYDLEFASATRGWVGGEFGIVLRTDDGGASWQPLQTPIETTLFGLEFTDEQTGWAVGIESVMLTTNDGGETWKRRRTPRRRGFALAFYDLAIQDQKAWVIGDSGFVLRSGDGGEKWSIVELPIVLAGNWFRGISLTPEGTGLIVGSDGEMIRVEGDDYTAVKQRQ